MEEEEFDTLVTEVYQGVPIYSRDENARELKEMRAFVDELIAKGLRESVSKLEYDSKTDLCVIYPGEYDDVIARIGEKHITQFEWHGIVHHKR